MPGPSIRERRIKGADGLRWCRGCAAWLPAEKVLRQGACQPCQNAEAKSRYNSDPEFRQRVIGHSMARRANVAPVPPDAAISILEDFEGECAYCDAPATTWDHVVPVSKGGLTEPYNIVPACRPCNSSKRDADLWDWLEATGRMVKDQAIDRMSLYDSGLYLAQGPSPY